MCSLPTDILLGLLKKIRRKRPDLRVIISSATLDAQAFKAFFEDNKSSDPALDTAAIVSVEGRQFPVEVMYTSEPVRDYIQGSLDCVRHIHANLPPGDILVFLTGKEEIEQVVSYLASDGPEGLLPLALYAGVPPGKQVPVFAPAKGGVRKVVVSTNVAETSLTIPGIVYVIDSGFSKVRSFDPRSGVSSLLVTPIAQANADQRAGRAGRVQPGFCFRLYTEDSFHQLPQRIVPEVQRCNLATVVLQLKALGIDDVLHFPFLSPPPVALLSHALELLFACGALDQYCKLTKPIGTVLAELPLDPQMARMLVASGEYECSEEVLSIAAMLCVESIFTTPKGNRREADRQKMKFAVKEGDHLTLLNVYNSFLLNKKDPNWCNAHFLNFRALKRANDIRKQLRKYCSRFEIELESNPDPENIRKCVVAGFFSNAAQLQPSGKYKTVRGQEMLELHPSSVLHGFPPPWVVFHDLVLTSKPYMRDVTVIDPMWLSELAPHYYAYVPPKHGDYPSPSRAAADADPHSSDPDSELEQQPKSRATAARGQSSKPVGSLAAMLREAEQAALREAPNNEPQKKHRRLF